MISSQSLIAPKILRLGSKLIFSLCLLLSIFFMPKVDADFFLTSLDLSPCTAYAQDTFYTIHISSYRIHQNAINKVSRLEKYGFEAFYRYEYVPGKAMWYRVYIGRFGSKNEARKKAEALRLRKVISYYDVTAITDDIRGLGHKIISSDQHTMPNHITEDRSAKHSWEDDLTLVTKGYIKTITSASETVFGENYFLDLTRARFDLNLKYGKHIALRAVYDQEALLGDYLRTLEFQEVKDVEAKDFLDLDWTLLDRKNIFWRHSFYRVYGQYKSEKISLTAGRQRIAWGTGRLWNPTDLFNSVDPLQLEQDEKRGIDAVGFDWFFSDFSFLNFVYAPQASREDLKTGIRFKTSLENWDLSFMGGRFEEDEVIGGDFSTTLFEGGLRGEMTYTRASGDNNDDFLRFVLSYDYSFENSVYFLLEYFYNGGNLPAFDLTSFFQDGIATVQKNFFGLNLGYDITPLVRAETLFIWDVDGESIFIWPKLIWSVAQNLDATLSAQIYHGDEGSEFGPFSNLYHAQLQYFF